MDWQTYYAVTKDKLPSPLLEKALLLVQKKEDALDLGCGAGRDTKLLLKHGFNVTAVDQNKHALAYLLQFPQQQLHIVCSSYVEFQPGYYDLINAQYSLPFTPKETFETVFRKVKQAMKPSGIFTGQLFGMHDDSNKSGTSMSFFTRQQVENLLKDMDLRELHEEETDEPTAQGMLRHWHLFHIIAQKPRLC